MVHVVALMFYAPQVLYMFNVATTKSKKLQKVGCARISIQHKIMLVGIIKPSLSTIMFGSLYWGTSEKYVLWPIADFGFR